MKDATQSNVDSIAPILLVRDIYASVDWYTDKLGFKVEKIWGEPPSFAMANAGDCTIMLKQSQKGPRDNAASLSGMWDAYIWVRDMKPVMEMLQSGGVAIHRGPEEAPYGCEEVEVRDPDGHLLCFGACR